MSYGGPVITYSGVNEAGVRLLDPQTNDFQDELRLLTAGASPDLLPDILPYSIIIKNGSARFIAALVVLYRVENPQRQPVLHNFFLGSTVLQRNRMLAPGQTRFVCPVPFLFEAANRGQLAYAPPPTDELRADARRRLSRYTSQKAINISLDAVVFEDGEIVGRDESKTMATLNAWIRAESDIRSAAAVRDAAQVRAYLEEIVSRPAKRAATPLEVDQYEVRLRDFASTMLRVLGVSEQVFRSHLAAGAESGISKVFRRPQ